MTITAHVYSATVGATALSIRGGSLSLDSGRAPHVQGNIEIALPGAWSTVAGKPVWTPSTTALDALDPRTSPAPRVTVTCSAGIPRTFNLHVRDRGTPTEDGTVSLVLSSDEGLLADYAPLADDDAPLTLASSIRAVVNYALGKAIPGATLAASPATDANVSPLWSVTNLHTNPEVVNTYGFGAGQGASSLLRVTFGSDGAVRWTTAAGVSNLVCTPTQDTFRVTPGKTYVFTIRCLSSAARVAQAALQWYAAGSGSPMGTNYGVSAPTNSATWTTVSIIARAPKGAATVLPFVSTGGNSAGDFQYVRRPMVYEGTRVVPDFSGADAATADYTFAWMDAAHGSPSIRTPKRDTTSPDALVWSAGQTAMDFLHPLLQAKGLRLVCNEARVWTLRDENYEAAGSLSLRHAVNIIDADEATSRDAGYWFDARVTRYRWTDPDGIPQERVDAYALSTPYSRLATLDVESAYPGPGRSEYAVRRAQGVGREITVETVSDWAATADQPVNVVLENGPPGIGRIQSVTFNLTDDRMTVTTRTVDTPLGSINLLAGTVNALSGTINAL